jgi:hypothetical protein
MRPLAVLAHVNSPTPSIKVADRVRQCSRPPVLVTGTWASGPTTTETTETIDQRKDFNNNKKRSFKSFV